MPTSKSLAGLLLWGFFPLSAWAYIDPNTAGLLYQALLPLLAFVVAMWRWIKQAIMSFFYAIKRALMGPEKNSPSEEKVDAEVDKKIE